MTIRKHSKKVGFAFVTGATCLALGLGACGKSSKSDDTTEETVSTTSTATSNSDLASENNLTVAVPTNLTLSAFPQTSAASLAGDQEAMNADDASAPTANANKTPEQEQKGNRDIQSGKAESCLPPVNKKEFKAPDEETCYEFDQEMIVGKNPSGKAYGTANGKNAKGEACLVSFGRSQIQKIKDPYDRMSGFRDAAICQARKEEHAKQKAAGTAEADIKIDLLPKNVGDSLDLTPYLKNALSKGGDAKSKVTSIKVTRLADVSSLPVYQTVFEMTDGDGNTRAMTLNHSPKDTKNEEFSGVLYFKVVPPAGKADLQQALALNLVSTTT